MMDGRTRGRCRYFPHPPRGKTLVPNSFLFWAASLEGEQCISTRLLQPLLKAVFPGGFQARWLLTLYDVVSTLLRHTWLKESDKLHGKRPEEWGMSAVLTGEPKTLLFSGLCLAARLWISVTQLAAILFCSSIFLKKKPLMIFREAPEHMRF